MTNNTEIQIINQQEVLGKDFKVYGTFDKPLFLAKDVAEWIEYSKSGNGSYNVSQMLSSIDEDEKLVLTMLVAGQNRQFSFLTEDGLYEVLMQSRKPIAKQFKKQVKIILKTIRQTGNYIGNVNLISPEIIESIVQKYLPCINTKNLNIWKAQTVKPLITTLSEKLQIDTRTAYDLVYNHMTSKYGFSRSFAITQFCDKYRVVEASVIDAIADDYTLQSWLVQSINDIMDYVNNVSLATSELNTIQSRRTFSLSDSVADIVSKVSAVNGDRSANHARTYGKIYSEITTKSGWKNLRTRYGGSNKDIVESNIKYKKKFIAVANKMMNNKGE